MIDRRQLGSTGISVSALGMGCGMLGSVWHRRPDREGKAAVATAIESGITFFDTADCYGLGRSERLLGNVIKRMGKRNDVVIATKCGLIKTPGALFRGVASSADAAGEQGPGARLTRTVEATRRLINARFAYSAGYIERSVDASLRRLGTDHLDVFFLHSPPREVLESGAFAEIFAGLKKKGKIRASGVSLRAADDALHPISRLGVDCIELEMNICSSRTRATTAVITEAVEAGLAIVARQPFGSGSFFNGEKIGSMRSVRRACLQFALYDPRVSVVIPGMTSDEHVRENVADAMAEALPMDLVDELGSRMCKQLDDRERR